MPHVLVVSEDPKVREEARSGFPEEFEVTVADDARQGIAEIKKRVPDVVIIDLQTGSAGGFALARDMSFDPASASVPTIMLLEREQDRWLAAQAGAQVVHLKPVPVNELVDQTLTLLAKT